MTPQRFDAGDVRLDNGAVLRDAHLAFATWGTLDARRGNAILCCTAFGARHGDVQWMIGPDKAFDPARYFIVVPDMLGNGLSTSPSHAGDGGAGWPAPTLADNVRLQRRLLREVLGVQRLALACGWSMGGMQAYHWAAMYPEEVERLAVVCGAARTAPHNQVFLQAVQAILRTDAAWDGRRFTEAPVRGLRALARFYAGWALSQTFYRDELWRQTGCGTLEEYLVRFWDTPFLERDAANILAQVASWQAADIAATPAFAGRLDLALQSIRARTLLLPSQTDLYFTVEDNRRELAHLRDARLLPIPSDWGHRAGFPLHNPADAGFIAQALRRLLDAGACS